MLCGFAAKSENSFCHFGHMKTPGHLLARVVFGPVEKHPVAETIIIKKIILYFISLNPKILPQIIVDTLK